MVQRGLGCFGNQHNQPTSTPTESDRDHAANRGGSILRKNKSGKSWGVLRGFQLNRHLSKMFC